MTGASPTLYPQYCFDLAPTSNTWCLLHASTIHALESPAGFEGQNVYFYRNLPIKWVRIVGVVVAIDDFAGWDSMGRRVFTIDDSSGVCIECNVAVKRPPADITDTATKATEPSRPSNIPEYQKPGCESLDVGSIIDIKGCIANFRDEKTIKIEKVKTLGSTEEEMVLWERRAAFKRDVLEKEWVLSEKQVRRARHEAGGEAEREERERRRQRRIQREKETSRQQHADAHGDCCTPRKAGAATQKKLTSRPYDRTPGGAAAALLAGTRLVLDESQRGKFGALGL